MTNPMAFASQVTGLPVAKAKKPTHRGRKPSGKPGASILAKLQQAHGAGDLAAAKTHALNFAKTLHQAMAAPADEPDPSGAPDESDPMGAPSTPTKTVQAPAPRMAQMPSVQPNRRAQLAKLAMSRMK